MGNDRNKLWNVVLAAACLTLALAACGGRENGAATSAGAVGSSGARAEVSMEARTEAAGFIENRPFPRGVLCLSQRY